jgi:hypothetical protein
VYISLVLSPDTVVRFGSLDSNIVYPTYPGRNNATTRKNWMDLEAKIAYGDSILRNYTLTVQRPVVVDSGGHSHNGNRPVGRYVYPIGSTDTMQTITARTDTAGRLRFRLVASQFGGGERIKACTVSDSTKFDTVSLITEVPGLQLLPDGTNYDLVGGTCTHYGPGAPTGCTTPDNNHLAAQVVRDSLPSMANVWDDSLRQDALFVNDISLPFGGLFDVAGNWRPEHAEHREGLDVDVRTAIPGVRNGVKVRNTQGKWVGNVAFEELAKKYGVKKAAGHKKGTLGEHYHLDY